jgi:hypothetical protein
MSRRLLSLITVVTMFFSCSTKQEKADPKLLTDQNLLHKNMHQLTEVIINDMFSPPVSSRIYAYTSLAAYEALKFNKPAFPGKHLHLHPNDNGFLHIPGLKKLPVLPG